MNRWRAICYACPVAFRFPEQHHALAWMRWHYYQKPLHKMAIGMFDLGEDTTGEEVTQHESSRV